MKKGIIISIVAVILAILGGWWYASSTSLPNSQDGTPSEARGFSLLGFFPFGRGGTENQNPNEGSTNNGVPIERDLSGLPVPDLRKVTEAPVAGAVVLGTGTSTIIRYIEKGTGHVYDTGTNSLALQKVSNTTIPKINSALWFSKGEALLMRYVRDDRETVESFYAKLISPKTLTGDSLRELEGVFLQKNIKEVVVSPDKTRIFSITKSGSKGVGVVSAGDGSKSSSFDLPISEFMPQWAVAGSITLTTKASAQALGYVYTLNTGSGSLSKLFGGVSGLTTRTRSDGSVVLFADKNLSLSIFETVKGDAKTLGVKTLPEKCVWSTVDKNIIYCAVPKSILSGDYPDAWYQGVVSFSDSLWKINISTGETSLVADFGKQGHDIDATELLLTPQENFLIFINKKDASLWTLRLLQDS